MKGDFKCRYWGIWEQFKLPLEVSVSPAVSWSDSPHRERGEGSSCPGSRHWRWSWQSRTCGLTQRLKRRPGGTRPRPPATSRSPQHQVSDVEQVAQERAAVILLTRVHLWCLLDPHLSQGVLQGNTSVRTCVSSPPGDPKAPLGFGLW